MLYLGASGQTFGRPIHGQMEVCAMSTPGTPETSWRTSEGLFILPSNFEPRAQGGRRYGNEHEHDEL
ncbi:unnamed protein product [Darwinula stevensoni]|uniref:Uncharacterized protein n=1 Tax=Darwinula stevensoni TaxID=69355 RepID=A0A7R9A658_9CRUS|nr:unnamed protein product [Darwinula stevensoni]CAG0888141.1 unnamed protein product [Darwinula stevensoni]